VNLASSQIFTLHNPFDSTDYIQGYCDMETIRINTKIASNGHLKLDVPTPLREGDVEVTLIIESKNRSTAKYSFSDRSGKLKWNGNALEIQRELRDEWQ